VSLVASPEPHDRARAPEGRAGRVSRRQVLVGLAVAAGSVGVGLSGVTLLPACEKVTSSEAVDRRQVLTDVTTLVIVPTHEEASTTAAALVVAIEALAGGPSVASLEGAQAAWRRARMVWKQTDAFSFGPSADLALTGGTIDTGPADVKRLEAYLAGTEPVDDQAMKSFPANRRGFAGIEALLFDPAKSKDAIVATFTAAGAPADRRRAAVAAMSRDLAAKIDLVRDAWLPGKGDYAGSLTRAGRGSSVYATERQGIDEIVNGIANASEVLIALRLAKPLGLDANPVAPHPELLESGLSDASTDDILAVLDGISNVYLTTRNGARGVPLGDAVHEFRPAGDELLRKQLVEARTALAAIPSPLRVAIVDHRSEALAAHEALREVKRRIVTDVASALGTTIGFSVTDGD